MSDKVIMPDSTLRIWLGVMLLGPALIGSIGGYLLRAHFKYPTLYGFFNALALSGVSAVLILFVVGWMPNGGMGPDAVDLGDRPLSFWQSLLIFAVAAVISLSTLALVMRKRVPTSVGTRL